MIINKHSLHLIEEACVIVTVIRIKTANHVGGCHLVPSSIQPRDVTCMFITPVVAFTAGKLSKYGVISGPYFPVFVLNTKIYSVNNYGLEITPYLGHFSHCLDFILYQEQVIFSFAI